MDIKDFFLDYLYAKDLKEFIDDMLGLPKSGKKEEVIDRILESDRFHPNLLKEWYLKEELKELCEDLRLPVSGNKQTLWERILEATNHFDNKYEKIDYQELSTPNRIELLIKKKYKTLSIFFIWFLIAFVVFIISKFPQEFQDLISLLGILAMIASIIGFIFSVVRFFQD